MPAEQERRIYVCKECGHTNSDWWRDRDNSCEVCDGETEYFVPESRVQELEGKRDELAKRSENAERALDNCEIALHLERKNRAELESHLARLEEALREIIRENGNDPDCVAVPIARSALDAASSTPPSTGEHDG